VVIPEQEGWYTDPWGHHEARWMSDGVPTKLVRDAGLESYDDPPDSAPSQAWVPIKAPLGSLSPADTLRADALEAGTTPSLAELNKLEDSAALTARAHPWFVARDWAPSSTATATAAAAAGRTRLIVGGVLAVVILLLSAYLWVVDVIAMLTPPPPAWGGAIIGSVFALAAPVGTYLMWRGDRRAKVSPPRRLERAELCGGLLGILTLVVFMASHLVA
jgi:hypothetical protein